MKPEPDPAGIGPLPGETGWVLSAGDGSVLRGYARPAPGRRCGVFVHGFRSHCDGGKARRLSHWAGTRGHGWVRYDQRGCGASGGSFRQFTVSAAVSDLQRVVAGLGDGGCILVGSSLGALVAARAAAGLGGGVAGLLLIAPAVRFADRFILDNLDDEALARWRRRGFRWFPDLYTGGCYRLDAGFLEDALRIGRAPPALPCPVRTVHGSRDEVLPAADTQQWLEALDCPAKALEIIEGGDHRLTDRADTIVHHAEILWNESLHSCA